MAAQGAISVRVYAGNEALPIADAGVHIVESEDGSERLIAYRTTDKNGKTSPVFIDTPAADTSASPGQEKPYKSVDIHIRHPLYHMVDIYNVQVFADTLTRQQVQMIPMQQQAHSLSTQIL